MKTNFNLLLLSFLLSFQSCIDETQNNLPHNPGPPPTGVPTNVGAPIGDLITQEIGPEGGTINWADGKYQLVFPEGALISNKLITIQPITHTLELALGTAFDFGPDGLNFERPVELFIRYDEDELSGTSPELVQIAFQDNNGIWQSLRNLEVNKANKTIMAKLPHFSRWSFFASAMILPGQKSLGLLQSADLEVVGYEFELNIKTNSKYRDLLSPLVPPSLLQSRLVKEWLIDGKISFTNHEKGTLIPLNDNRSKAKYTAPTAVPDRETVTVSAELNLGKGKFLLLAQITIQGNNEFQVGPYSFSNTTAIIGRNGNVLHITMSKPNSSGFESVLSFAIPKFAGVGSYSFSKEVNGAVALIGEERNFHSIGYNDKSEPFFNGSIQISESSTDVGGNIAGTMSGTLYEAIENNGKFVYVPYDFQASFSTTISY